MINVGQILKKTLSKAQDEQYRTSMRSEYRRMGKKLTDLSPGGGRNLPEGGKGVGRDALELGELGKFGENPAELHATVSA